MFHIVEIYVICLDYDSVKYLTNIPHKSSNIWRYFRINTDVNIGLQ